MLAIAGDHAGWALKEEVVQYLKEEGYNFEDFGTFNNEPADYPDLALKVAETIILGQCTHGILLCGTGIGISIAANKVPGIRAALCNDVYSARFSRAHNDANILVLGGRVLGVGLAQMIVQVWLSTEFAGERHARRLDKIRSIEEKYCRFCEKKVKM